MFSHSSDLPLKQLYKGKGLFFNNWKGLAQIRTWQCMEAVFTPEADQQHPSSAALIKYVTTLKGKVSHVNHQSKSDESDISGTTHPLTTHWSDPQTFPPAPPAPSPVGRMLLCTDFHGSTVLHGNIYYTVIPSTVCNILYHVHHYFFFLYIYFFTLRQ